MSDATYTGYTSGVVPPGRVSAVAAIAKKELLELFRDARLLWIGGLFALLMLAALLLGWQQMQRTEMERTAAQNVSYEQWLGQGERNPHTAAHFGQYAFKPSSPLLFVDPGITPFVGVGVWMEAHKQNEFKFRPARDATSLQRFGELSIAFVLQVLAPLIIILLTFSAFTGEREHGTLRQLLSVGVQPMSLLAGKALSIVLILGALFLPFVAAGLIALPFLIDHDESIITAVARAVLMAAGYAVYLFGVSALSLGTSALLKSSRKALVVLLAFWVMNSFVMPRIMTDLARVISPTPTAVEFQNTLAEARKANFGHDDSHPGYLEFRNQVLQQYGVSEVEQLPVDFKGLALREDDERGYRIFDKNYGALWHSYALQERIRGLAGFLFPLAVMQPVSMGLAGSDTAHHNDFARAAEVYRRQIQSVISEDLINNRKYGDKDYKASPALWAEIPAFDYQTPGIGWVLQQQWLNLAILTIWAVIAGLFAIAATRRLTPL